MKATARLTVPDAVRVTLTVEMSIGEAKELREQITSNRPPTHWTGPLEGLKAVLKDSIATAEASHAAEIDPKKRAE